MTIPPIVASLLPIVPLVLGSSIVAGQGYPSKPVRIVTVQTGGGTDFAARLIAQGISGPLGQPVIVENRPTIIAIQTASKALPDGYTVLVSGSTLWTGTLLQDKPLWDPVKDFAPITVAFSTPNVIVVHPSVPVKSIKELIALARARPGELNYALGSIGGVSHMTGELFKSMAGVNIVGIPYKGSSLSMNALIGGEVQVGFEGATSVIQHIKSGRVRALAVASAQPSALTPGLPTVAASGLPGFQSGSMQGVWAPAKTPAPIIKRLNQEIVRVLHLPEVRQKVLDSGAEPVGNSPEEFAATIKSDLARLSKVVKDAGIHAE